MSSPNGADVQEQTAAHDPDTPAPTRSHVYSIGRIEPRFPSLGIEKELAQATGRAVTAGLSDRQAVHAVLAEPANRYLVRKLCWVLTVEGQDTYLLVPRDATDLDLLIDAVRPSPTTDDLDVVIGVLGPLASPEMCNGLVVPLVGISQIYSFAAADLLSAIPRPESIPADQFDAAASELFSRVQQLADNAGAIDEHRALNYLVVRYPTLYAHVAERFAADSALTSVDVMTSRLSGIRTLVNVVFTFTDRSSGVIDKSSVRVDVTEEFPFLVSPLQPYYQR